MVKFSMATEIFCLEIQMVRLVVFAGPATHKILDGFQSRGCIVLQGSQPVRCRMGMLNYGRLYSANHVLVHVAPEICWVAPQRGLVSVQLR